MKGKKVYEALYGRGTQPAPRGARNEEGTMGTKKKPELTDGSEPIEGGPGNAAYYREEDHGFRMTGHLDGTYADKKGRTRYRFALDTGPAAGNVIVLPDHYNLNQKLGAVSAEDYADTRLEVVFCGRTLENAQGEPVKDQSGKQMYEWLVGKVPATK